MGARADEMMVAALVREAGDVVDAYVGRTFVSSLRLPWDNQLPSQARLHLCRQNATLNAEE